MSTQIVQRDDHLTASAFMMADMKSNQIASFYPGPAELAQEIDAKALGDKVPYALLGATGPEVMRKHTRELGAASCKLIYDPAFQIIILSGEELHGRDRRGLVRGRQRLRVRDDGAQDRTFHRRDRRALRTGRS